MTATILIGHAIEKLRGVAENSVHMCCSSPPYYGKRDYGVPPSVWGGDEECEHRWGEELLDRSRRSPGTQGGSLTGDGRYQAKACRFEIRSNFCVDCGAWRGALGLEPTPELYVEHLVMVFEEVRRVLRPDGVLFLNLGDTYATGAGQIGDHPGGGGQGAKWKGGPPSESSTLEGNGHVGGGPKLKALAPVPREDAHHRGGERASSWATTPAPGDTSWAGPRGKKIRATRDGTHAGKNTGIAARGPMTQPNRMPLPGLKPKDLIGIPWLVAKALQAPKYLGRIKRESDRAWLAAIIDGEGCFFVHKRKAGTPSHSKFQRVDGTEANYARTADTYGVGLEISNTSKAIIEKVASIVPKGTFTTQSPDQNGRRKQTIYRWRLAPNDAKKLAQEVYPHLVAKQQQARIIFSCPSNGDAGAAAHQAMMDLHRGAETSVDFPPPPALWAPGWWLRSEMIWSKLNPMPESISDRCTVSHEQVFLLAKSARYFYDAAAVAEPASYAPGCGWEEEPKGTRGGKRGVPQERAIDPEQSFRAIRATRNKRTVWAISTTPFPGAHFATFPPKLVEPCVLAGTSERGCCVECGAPWVRVLRKIFEPQDDVSPDRAIRSAEGQKPMDASNGWEGYPRGTTQSETVGWWPSCRCEGLPRLTPYPKKPRTKDEAELNRWKRACAAVDAHRGLACDAERGRRTKPAVVLDPFGGACTTAMVADRLQRDSLTVELNPEYAEMGRHRLEQDGGMFARAAE